MAYEDDISRYAIAISREIGWSVDDVLDDYETDIVALIDEGFSVSDAIEEIQFMAKG